MWDGTGSKLMARVPTGKMWRVERKRPSPSGIVRRDSALPRSPDTVNETGSELQLPQACLPSCGAEWPTSQDSSKAPRVQCFPPAAKLLKMANYYFSSFLSFGLFMHLKWAVKGILDIWQTSALERRAGERNTITLNTSYCVFYSACRTEAWNGRGLNWCNDKHSHGSLWEWGRVLLRLCFDLPWAEHILYLHFQLILTGVCK